MRPYNDPFEGLMQLQKALSRAASGDFFGLSTYNRGEFPGINVFKTGESYELRAELPGVKKADLRIEVTGQIVRIAGERQRPQLNQEKGDGQKAGSENGVSRHRSERKFGAFDRSVKLPNLIDAQRVTAAYEDGVLKLTLPIAESDKPRQISISTAQEA